MHWLTSRGLRALATRHKSLRVRSCNVHRLKNQDHLPSKSASTMFWTARLQLQQPWDRHSHSRGSDLSSCKWIDDLYASEPPSGLHVLGEKYLAVGLHGHLHDHRVPE